MLMNFGVKKENIEIIPNGVNIVEFDPNLNKSSFLKSIKQRFSIIILHVGRIAKVKGIDILIHALNSVLTKHKDIGLLIVGSDYGYKKQLEILIDKLGLNQNIIFCGTLPKSLLLETYYISDIVVIPSEIEMFGMASIEAGFFGKPVIATNVGSIPEIIQDEFNGFLVPYGDPVILASKILTLINNPELRNYFGRNARNRVLDKYSWERIVDSIESVYKKIKRSYI